MSTQEKLEQPFLERILYIGNEIPESLVEDKRDKFILLGTPQDLVSEVQALIDSAKREELELYVKYIENTDKFYPLYASLDRETAIDECRKFASNYGKHRIAQLEQSEERINSMDIVFVWIFGCYLGFVTGYVIRGIEDL